MDQQMQEIREQQKATWNKSSAGWKKWDDLTMEFLQPFGDEIIRQLRLNDSDIVLDVAAGTGEPGLTIASKLKSGKVIITDLAGDMLAIAQENAMKSGVKNAEFLACDVCELPFSDNAFDAISCRMGFMFFPDMLLAVKELMRALKPGGRIAISVWGAPEKNFWFAGTMAVVNKYVHLPLPAAGAPGMFRCAQQNLMADLFANAGLKNITQTEVTSRLDCGSIDTYWNFMTEVAGPVIAALTQATSETAEKIKTEVYEALRQKYQDGNILIEGSAWVIASEK